MKKGTLPNGNQFVELGDDEVIVPSDIFAFGHQIEAVQNDKVYVIGNGLNGLYTLGQLEEHFRDLRDSQGA